MAFTTFVLLLLALVVEFELLLVAFVEVTLLVVLAADAEDSVELVE